MRCRRSGFTGFFLGAFLLLTAAPVAAQEGTLTGRVSNAETGEPIPQAQISILGTNRGTLSNTEGRYTIALPAGTYDIAVEVVGYRSTRFDNITVAAGQITNLDMKLYSQAQELEGMVVTASRGVAEKATETVATTHVVGSLEIEEKTVTTPAEYLRNAPGVDIITEGVQSTNVVVRGFNNIFSGALHMLTDNRLAGVPSLRVNLMHFIPANSEDVERMEVVLGPGSALYGPNTANGVVHIITKSPLDDQGTTVSLAGGERSVFQGQFRSAFLVSDNLGFKISGQYLKGNEWEYTDPVEAAARQQALTDPAACLTDKAIRGFDVATAELSCARVGQRDFDIERYGFEARADLAFGGDGRLVGTYGRTSATGIELTGLGAGQTKDWIYEFYQARLRKGRLFAQAYINKSDAGNSFLLRDGVPLIDNSKLIVAQIQHGFSVGGDAQNFTYGVDYFGTRPDTKGSINGSYEDNDNFDEWGVYLQSKTALSDKLDLVFAGRMDSHSLLPDDVFSPRAGLVFRPTEDQSIRFSYNRAFSTPSSLNFFLDISGGAAPAPLGPLGYTIRAFGTGPNGYSFQNPDGSLRGIRSPFNPAGADKLLPADPAVLWQLAVGVLQAQGAIDAGTAQLLGSLSPTSSDIGLMLFDITTQEVTPLSATRIPDVPSIRESNTETFEVGWTGIIQERLKVTADVYWMKKNNFVSPLLVQTPLVLLNGQDVGSFITVPLVTAITQQLIAAGLDPATAQAQAQAQAAVLVPQLAAGIAQIPLGVVSSDQVAAKGADIIVTYRNVGDVSLWGADFAFQWFLNDQWTLNGTYSHVSDDYFKITDGAPIALNAPKDKGSLAVAYRNTYSGFNAEARMRFSSSFPAESAGFVGTKCITGGTGGVFEEDCVEAFTLFDVNLGYKIPNTAATIQASVTNLFNTGYRSFVGVPKIGRFAMFRVKYDLF
ncbi:MAG: TonB-dependent receptor domain-containing protein [Gemmatimonadota bacterium]